MLKLICRWGFALLLAGVVYLSVRPPLALATVPWIPHPLGAWLDGHNFVANVVAFGVLAGVGLMAFARPAGRWHPAWVLGAVGGLVVALELVQLRLPGRVCDWRDVAAGWIGAAGAWGVWRSVGRERRAESGLRSEG